MEVRVKNKWPHILHMEIITNIPSWYSVSGTQAATYLVWSIQQDLDHLFMTLLHDQFERSATVLHINNELAGAAWTGNYNSWLFLNWKATRKYTQAHIQPVCVSSSDLRIAKGTTYTH